jgi:hypothetical protein
LGSARPIAKTIHKKVDQITAKRKRKLLITEATREKRQKERFLRALEETQGAWNDKNHPDLKTARDMEKFVGSKRQGYRKRLKASLKKKA